MKISHIYLQVPYEYLLLFFVFSYLLDFLDPQSEFGSGPRRPIECGSETLSTCIPVSFFVNTVYVHVILYRRFDPK
jgi:hypothetical protein